MRSLLSIALLAFSIAPLPAEFLRIEQRVAGLDCLSCASSVERVLRKIKGVETVTFQPKDAVAVMDLKPGNAATLEQVRDAVKGIGYTPAAANVTVRGQIHTDAGKWLLKAAGERSYELDLSQAGDAASRIRSGAGQTLVVEGTVEPQPGQAPVIQVKSARAAN